MGLATVLPPPPQSLLPPSLPLRCYAASRRRRHVPRRRFKSRHHPSPSPPFSLRDIATTLAAQPAATVAAAFSTAASFATVHRHIYHVLLRHPLAAAAVASVARLSLPSRVACVPAGMTCMCLAHAPSLPPCTESRSHPYETFRYNAAYLKI